MSDIISQNEKRISLERERADLRAKLLITENEVNKIEASEKVSESLLKELNKIKEELSVVTKERDELRGKLSDLHQRLREVDNTAGMTQLTLAEKTELDDVEEEEERIAKNREAYLNVMLLKAKQEKQKALKLIINLLGKETVQKLLHKTEPATTPEKDEISSPLVLKSRKSLTPHASSPNLFTTPPGSVTKKRSPTRSTSFFVEELMKADSPSMNNTTIGNDLLDRLIVALSGPKPRQSVKSLR